MILAFCQGDSMSMYVFCENNNGQSNPNGNNINIQTSPLNMVTITLMNGTVFSNVSVNPDGSVWMNNNKILENSSMSITTLNGTNCTAFMTTISTITIRYSVISSIFSQVDPIFFNIYKMINGDGSYADTNRTIYSSNVTGELEKFYSEMNNTIRNITVN